MWELSPDDLQRIVGSRQTDRHNPISRSQYVHGYIQHNFIIMSSWTIRDYCMYKAQHHYGQVSFGPFPPRASRRIINPFQTTCKIDQGYNVSRLLVVFAAREEWTMFWSLQPIMLAIIIRGSSLVTGLSFTDYSSPFDIRSTMITLIHRASGKGSTCTEERAAI